MPEFIRRQLNPENLFELRYVHDAKFSPNGKRVAFVVSETNQTDDEQFRIIVEDVASRTRLPLEYRGQACFPRWSPDGDRIAFVGSDDGTRRLYIADNDLKSLTAVSPADIHVYGAPSWSPDGLTVAYAAIKREKAEPPHIIGERIFRADGIGQANRNRVSLRIARLETGATQVLGIGDVAGFEPCFSPCGRRLLFRGGGTLPAYPALSESQKLYLWDIETQTLSEILGDGWFIAAAAWSSCGKRIVVAGDFNSTLPFATAALWTVRCDGSDLQCRTQGLTGNIGFRAHHDMPTWNTSQGNMVFVRSASEAIVTVTKHGCAEIWNVALDGAARHEVVVSGPRSALVMDVCASTGALLYCVCDFHNPWDLYLKTSSIERQLTNFNDAIVAQWPKLRTEHLRFESPDGTAVEAWFLSRADQRGPQPTVLFIHGGPFIATGHAFRFDFHLLAANGYAVLLSNFRGSAGYGAPFAQAIVGDWGAKGFVDHMAAVDAAIARGLVDPKRLGVWGPSHGGFATAWIICHTNRFRAAVAESALINLSTMYYLSDAPDWIVRDLGGRPDEIPDVYRSRSPLTYASRCQTPTLLLHGEDDLRCPIAEAEQFFRALLDAECHTELARIPGMSHLGDSIGPLSVRRQQNEYLLQWFERHL